MTPPFSATEFFAVFARYNQAVWPMPAVLLLLAVGLVLVSLRRPRTGRWAMACLAFLWAWMAVAYHWLHFRPVNPAAAVFATLFLLEAIGLTWYAAKRDVVLSPRGDLPGLLGWALIVYALILYPIIGHLAGHTYPAHPTFGAPCPTTIFTIGILLWVRGRVPWGLLVVPAIWSVIGFSAVRYFGVFEDAVLPIAGLIGGGLIFWRGRPSPTTPS